MTQTTTKRPTAPVEPPARSVNLAAPLAPGEGLGHQIQPWVAMGSLFIAAGAARVAIHAAGHDAEVAWTVTTVAFAVAVVTAWATRRRFMPTRLRSRFVAALYLGAGWVGAVAHLGMSWGAVAVLTLVGTSMSLAFWSEHRIGTPVEVALPKLREGDPFVERWARNLGAQGKALAGSRLLPNPELIRAGYKYTLELVPGSQTVSGALVLGDQLRGGLRLAPGQEVIVEEHPTEPAPTALLTIVVKSPIRQARPWPGAADGFDPAAGAVNLGPFVDDEGVAQWDVYRQNGIFGGFLQGDPGSGKSRMFESIAMSVAASESHPTVVWFGCGQGGASSPMLVEHADWAATTVEDFHEMLQAAERVMELNGLENKVYRLPGFTPAAHRPGLLLFVDELHGLVDAKDHLILGPSNQRRMLRLAREGRKAGVALIAADQSPTLDAFGGAGNGSDTLRSCLLNGNGALLKSETNNAKQVFKVDIDPRRFPKLPGYAYLARPREGTRSAPYRGYWVTDEQISTEPGRITWRSLNHRQTQVAGERYAKRHEIAQERQAELELRLQLIDQGLLDTVEEMDRQLAAAEAAQPRDFQLEFADGIPAIRPVGRFWLTGDPKAQPMTPGETRVLAALSSGPAKVGQLAQAADLSPQGADLVLKRLADRGLVVQPQKYGPYELAGQASRAA
jgi:MarR family